MFALMPRHQGEKWCLENGIEFVKFTSNLTICNVTSLLENPDNIGKFDTFTLRCLFGLFAFCIQIHKFFIEEELSDLHQVFRKIFSVAYQNRPKKFYMFIQGYRSEGETERWSSDGLDTDSS